MHLNETSSFINWGHMSTQENLTFLGGILGGTRKREQNSIGMRVDSIHFQSYFGVFGLYAV